MKNIEKDKKDNWSSIKIVLFGNEITGIKPFNYKKNTFKENKKTYNVIMKISEKEFKKINKKLGEISQ
jgi:hypothetical protein